MLVSHVHIVYNTNTYLIMHIHVKMHMFTSLLDLKWELYDIDTTTAIWWIEIHQMAVVVSIWNSIDTWTSIINTRYSIWGIKVLNTWYWYHLSLRQTNRRKQFVETATNSCCSWNTLQRLYENVLEVRKMEKKLNLISNRLLMRRSAKTDDTTKQS